MTTQNLVSASLAPEVRAEILTRIGEVRERLHFLLSLDGSEIRSLFKAGNGFMPFLEKAYNSVNDHPSIMPGVFDINEFKRDFQLSRDLTVISNQVNELANGIQNTLLAVNSDAMAAALEVYSAVKLNRDRVSGLNVVADEMGEFFKRPKRKKNTGV